MSTRSSQDWFVPAGVRIDLPSRMRLAPSERKRLWKGFEWFVNCGDTIDDFQTLGRVWPDFWPIHIQYFPNERADMSQIEVVPATDVRSGTPVTSNAVLTVPPEYDPAAARTTVSAEELERRSRTEDLDWNPACHKLFLFYRDLLRIVWRGANKSTHWLTSGEPEFLLGLTDWNDRARDEAKHSRARIQPINQYLSKLCDAWEAILRGYPSALPEAPNKISVNWNRAGFYLVPGNDFERAFFALFRQNWKARICPGCKLFFIAQTPKQAFCGNVCSGGSRLASKRKWWKRVGAKRRAARTASKPHRKGQEPR